MISPCPTLAKRTRRGQKAALWLLIGILAAAGCAHVEANYPKNQGPKKWVGNLNGPQCEYANLEFNVDAESRTLEIREMMDGLDGKMKAGMSKAAFRNMKKQAYVGYELSAAMQEDRNHVFYHASLTLNDSSAVVLHRGCLVLTIETEQGIVETTDAGILFLKHANRNDFVDSGSGPVSFGLEYNRLAPADENEIFVRSSVAGTIRSVTVDSAFVQTDVRRSTR
ncbi:MAG: hypothetical protein QNL91_04025 [Candidatus Krumholzibacteria bacterium]|nr:hypothetical protein [Candidatus Krumholzibacteria bacterium]